MGSQTLMKTGEKESWINKYANRILDSWQKWKSPLGLDKDYVEQVRSELEGYFDDPLKKQLIENTY